MILLKFVNILINPLNSSGLVLVAFELMVPAADHYPGFLIVYGITGIFIGCRQVAINDYSKSRQGFD